MKVKSGISIRGIKKAASETINWPVGSGGYTEIFYDRSNGNVWTVDQVSLGHNSLTVYDDPSIIKITETEHHMNTKEISEAVKIALQGRKKERNEAINF